jgi:hypothetical protein
VDKSARISFPAPPVQGKSLDLSSQRIYMKTFILSVIFSNLFLFAQAQTSEPAKPDPDKKIEIVEASCGQCKFGLPGKGCSLAVRIDGKAYFVDGSEIDSHGDAHAKDGFCNAIRKAEVQGMVENKRFKVQYFKLLPTAKD